MNEAQTKSSDKYSYCKICRLNHTQKRKHLFTNKHKQKLSLILKKFGSKIKLSRPYLENPIIEEGEHEPSRTFWCHFCFNNFNKHVTDRLKTIINGGILEHIASEEHLVATNAFWHNNGADIKFRSSFVISETDFQLYKQKLIPLVDKYDSQVEERTKKVAKNIKSMESQRLVSGINSFAEGTSTLKKQITCRTLRNKHGVLQNPSGYHDGVRVWKGGIIKYKSGSDQITSSKNYSIYSRSDCSNIKNNGLLYTVSAEAEGISKVSYKVDASKGNIHSGATPPWLLENISKEKVVPSGVIVGPSVEEFYKHQKRLEKSKLNPKRVGANFDHSSSSREANWLPSFGRVWNDGARWKSRKQYQTEVNMKVKNRKKQF